MTIKLCTHTRHGNIYECHVVLSIIRDKEIYMAVILWDKEIYMTVILWDHGIYMTVMLCCHMRPGNINDSCCAVYWDQGIYMSHVVLSYETREYKWLMSCCLLRPGNIYDSHVMLSILWDQGIYMTVISCCHTRQGNIHDCHDVLYIDTRENTWLSYWGVGLNITLKWRGKIRGGELLPKHGLYLAQQSMVHDAGLVNLAAVFLAGLVFTYQFWIKLLSYSISNWIISHQIIIKY